MLCSRFILILMLAMVSARPSPELSLEEIEKELEELTAKENDASDASKTKSDQATSTKEDIVKQTETEVPKELTDKTREVLKEKLETLQKTVTDTEQKKDATTETKADTDKKATDTSADPAAEFSKKPAKPDFKDTEAFRRLLESEATNSHYPSLPRPHADYMKYDNLPSLRRPYHSKFPARRTYDDDLKYGYPPRRPFFPEAPNRRTFDVTYRKNYDQPPSHFLDSDELNRRGFLPHSDPVEILKRIYADRGDSDGNRRGFLANPDPLESLRGLPEDPDRVMTKTERTALSRGSWVPGSEPVKVPEKLPPPVNPDTAVRSYNEVHKQLNDKETKDLIRGKDGLTDAAKRKRYLMDKLAEKIKSKVAEAHKRGLKVPDKIMDFLWNYETRRGMDKKDDITTFSH